MLTCELLTLVPSVGLVDEDSPVVGLDSDLPDLSDLLLANGSVAASDAPSAPSSSSFTSGVSAAGAANVSAATVAAAADAAAEAASDTAALADFRAAGLFAAAANSSPIARPE